MTLTADFFAGVFLCNCIPHLASGLMGMPFPSPFARPAGIGDSPPVVNVLWGGFNLLVGLALLHARPFALDGSPPCLAFFGGAVLLGLALAQHFGRVRARR